MGGLPVLIEIRPATDLAVVRELFREYQVAANAPVCFTTFDDELAGLPAPYAAIFVAWMDGEAAGCVALKPLGSLIGEVKRLYVRASFRQSGLAQSLMAAAAQSSRELGWVTLRLDTLPSMTAAIALYRRLGFLPVARYNDNPDPSAHFFELNLT